MKQVNFSTKWLGSLLIITIVLFALLQPKLSSWLLPFKRTAMWNNFLTKVEREKNIDSRTFWEFREFYYPGHFTFKREGFQQNEVIDLEKKIGVRLPPESSVFPFLTYQSDVFTSVEYLVDVDNIASLGAQIRPQGKNYFTQKHAQIISVSDKEYKILFIKPTTDMVTANGYYDYRNKDDAKRIKDKYWLSISQIFIP